MTADAIRLDVSETKITISKMIDVRKYWLLKKNTQDNNPKMLLSTLHSKCYIPPLDGHPPLVASD